jgi:Protein of unknown function (DUF2384)
VSKPSPSKSARPSATVRKTSKYVTNAPPPRPIPERPKPIPLMTRDEKIQSISEALDQVKSILISIIPPDSTADLMTAAAVEAGPFVKRSVQELAEGLLMYPEQWLDNPNPNFGGRKPRDLLGTDEEVKVYNILNAADQGMF